MSLRPGDGEYLDLGRPGDYGLETDPPRERTRPPANKPLAAPAREPDAAALDKGAETIIFGTVAAPAPSLAAGLAMPLLLALMLPLLLVLMGGNVKPGLHGGFK